MSPWPDLKSEYADPKDYNRVLIRCQLCNLPAYHQKANGKWIVQCFGKKRGLIPTCKSPIVTENTLEDAIRVWNAFALLTR